MSSLEKELIDKLPQDSELRLQAEDSVRLENSSRRMNKEVYLLLGIAGILVLIMTFFNVINRIPELFG